MSLAKSSASSRAAGGSTAASMARPCSSWQSWLRGSCAARC